MAVFIKQNNQLIPIGNVDDPLADENAIVQRTTPVFQVCNDSTASYVGSCAFAFSPVQEVNLPNCSQIYKSAFFACSLLSTVNFSACTTISPAAFEQCINLRVASFPACTVINSYAFRSCYNLLSLYLLTSTVPTLASSSVFYSTPISSYTTSTGGVTGSIFVKTSLLASFKAATNWKTYSARMVGLTDDQIAALNN